MRTNRRDFLKAGIATAALPTLGAAFQQGAPQRLATDWVTLGKSNVKVTRLAFGTGTMGGAVQRELGQDAFNRLVRHAYDNGVRFFETADAYTGMPQMLAIALKGVPRDSYRLMTKYETHNVTDPMGTISRLRTDLGTDYVDIMLLHCVRRPTWPDDMKRLEDAFSEAKQKQIILSHGASVHGLDPLDAFPGNQWLDLAMIRMNHKGVKMDTLDHHDSDALGDVARVTNRVKQVKSDGMGVISMKLVGEGAFTGRQDRQSALHQAFNVAGVDCVTIGFKNNAEIDEAADNIKLVLNA